MFTSLIVGLIIVALVYWIITTLPLPPMVKTVATVILVVFVILWLLKFVGGAGLLGF